MEESQIKYFSRISTKEEYLLESFDNHPFWIRISISPLSYNPRVNNGPLDFIIYFDWRIILYSISDTFSFALCFIGVSLLEKISTESPFNDFFGMIIFFKVNVLSICIWVINLKQFFSNVEKDIAGGKPEKETSVIRL